MSAFMVSKRHIDLLVSTAFSGPRDAKGLPISGHWYKPSFNGFHDWQVDQLAALGQMLIEENLKSIHARYPDTINNPDATPGPIATYWRDTYQAPSLRYRLTTIEAFKALACYEYQSCEHKGWECSDAAKFCESMRHSLINVLPGYDDAQWEFDVSVGNRSGRGTEAEPQLEPIRGGVMTAQLANQIKAAKLSVQLAMEMCEFKSETGARLNSIWEELDNVLESAKAGDYDAA